jgi:hypothetical protein
MDRIYCNPNSNVYHTSVLLSCIRTTGPLSEGPVLKDNMLILYGSLL